MGGYTGTGPLSIGVAGEIRGYNFLQSAQSGLQLPDPFPYPALLPSNHQFSHESSSPADQKTPISLCEKSPFNMGSL
ncbi:hypothetical protein AMECASPLE_026394 [Ameca splendens]|uniref:Uncharacterized protein n=1 Tax=Ameca splendens TaxID=208324 RepID=A0ABV0ZE82_9TELE